LYILYKEQMIDRSRVDNIDEPKQRLLHVWHDMDQSIIDKAVDEWRGRFHACVAAKGAHFKQLL